MAKGSTRVQLPEDPEMEERFNRDPSQASAYCLEARRLEARRKRSGRNLNAAPSVWFCLEPCNQSFHADYFMMYNLTRNN